MDTKEFTRYLAGALAIASIDWSPPYCWRPPTTSCRQIRKLQGRIG
jgi:hypothetical protein